MTHPDQSDAVEKSKAPVVRVAGRQREDGAGRKQRQSHTDGHERDPRRRTRWRRLGLVAALVILTALNVALWLLSSVFVTPEQRASRAAAPAPSPLLVPVGEGPLLETFATRGQVVPGDSIDVRWIGDAPTGALEIITALPFRAGDSIDEGDVLYEVAGRPIFVLVGDLPMYRNLELKATGRDVLQLQTALSRMGYLAAEPDGTLGRDTLTAVTEWYHASGHGTSNEITRSSSTVVPRSEILYIPSAPARLISVAAEVGQLASDTVMTITTQQIVVETTLNLSIARLVNVGERVGIYDEISGTELSGRITSIGERVDDEDTAPAGLIATVEPDAALSPAWVGRDVRLTFANLQGRPSSLIVPEAALFTNGDGQTVVEVHNPLKPDDIRFIAVEVEAVAGGHASITPLPPGSLTAGDLVVVGFDEPPEPES
jgi:hypothetical protein